MRGGHVSSFARVGPAALAAIPLPVRVPSCRLAQRVCVWSVLAELVEALNGAARARDQQCVGRLASSWIAGSELSRGAPGLPAAADRPTH